MKISDEALEKMEQANAGLGKLAQSPSCAWAVLEVVHELREFRSRQNEVSH